MDDLEDRLLTRNGLATRRLAAMLLDQAEDARLPRLKDYAEQMGVGNGTAQAALQTLEDTGAIETVARGHLGTFLVRADRARLWRLAGLGTVLAAMPLPYSRRYEGLASGLRAAYEAAGLPFAVTFMRGATARVAALLEGKADVVVASRLAADRLVESHPVELVADLGAETYVGSHGLLLRDGVTVDAPGLRVAVDSASEDQRVLAERAFTGRGEDVVWVEASYMQLRSLFERGEVDATVWNLDEVQDRLGPGVRALPLDDRITRELAQRNSSAAFLTRAGEAGRFTVLRETVDMSLITEVQRQVVRGDRLPTY
ncbi:GntR family transcriptional regulator YhfZ [Actinomadura sp. NPDC047616]|uniref:GntR family transcriptional regulator YhfZ n=1 Tax=Actinomadura sp. NPDC047616 TaxID=3155914 RepID=UPI0033E874DF